MFNFPSSHSDKLWQVECRKLERDLQVIPEAGCLRSVVNDHLTQYFLRLLGACPPHKKSLELLNDFQSKSFRELQIKYLQDEGLPLLEAAPKAVAITLLKLFKQEGEFQAIVEATKQAERNQVRKRIVSEQFLPTPINKNELLRLLIQIKKVEQEKKCKEFNAFVVDIQDLSKLLTDLKSKSREEVQRFQILIRNEIHYTAVDIQFGPDAFSSFVMDAAGDSRREDVISCLRSCGSEEVFVAGLEYSNGSKEKLQFDSFSCPYFSYDHIRKTSKYPDLFDKLQKLPCVEGEGVKSLSWSSLPKALTEYAQRDSFLKVLPSENLPVSLVQNSLLYKKRDSLLQKAALVLDNYSDENLEDIVSGL